MTLTRRTALTGGSLVAGSVLIPPYAQAAESDVETYGLSTFGELGLPADFKSFGYVNPAAPKGGFLSIQTKSTSGNQNFDTFDTFNIYVFKGDGAAGMESTFDTLMTGSADEPDAAYGLVARAVRIAPDKLTYRFLLRPEARFHDGSRVTAGDVAFSLNILKSKGHPVYRSILREFAGAEAESDDTVVVRFTPNRSRDVHLVVAGMPIFSAAWWKGRDFEASTLEAPLGSGPYALSRFEQGRFVEYQRVADYWGAALPVNIGQNNFDRLRYSYFRDRVPAFESFKSGELNFNEEYTSKFWATQYDFPAVREGRVKKEEIANGAPPATQGWYMNTRRPVFADPRIREALSYAFDFEWTNKNIMYSTYRRLTSFFESPNLKAVGKPGPDELAIFETFRGKVADEVFGEPWLPPVSDGSGSDRALLRKADDLLRAAGCKRDGNVMKLPNGDPLRFEFLDSSPALQPHTEPFQANLRKLGIETTLRIVDAAQYKRRIDAYDFDVITMALGGSITPGDDLRNVFGSEGVKDQGSRNAAGVNDPVVDALITMIARADTRAKLNVATRCLDRVLRAGRYWVPCWYRDKSLVAYWDAFSRPAQPPQYGTGAPAVWWWDADKAKRINYGG